MIGRRAFFLSLMSLVLCEIFLFPVSASASQTILFQTTWGGPSNELGNGVALDASSNIYVTGYTNSFGSGGDNVLILKYSDSGHLLLQKTWGGNMTAEGAALAYDKSGALYIAGQTDNSGAGSLDALLLKVNAPTGNIIWGETWGGNLSDVASSLALDSSGNIYLAGSTFSFGEGSSDAFLLKFASNGSLLWQLTWGGNQNDFAWGVTTDSSNNVYVSGSTYSTGAGGADLFLLKFDGAGNLIWELTWGGNNLDYGQGVLASTTGAIYVTGYTMSSGSGSADTCLLKFQPNGTLIFAETWGGSGYDAGNGIAGTEEGGVYVTGYTTSLGVRGDAVLLKFDASGTLLAQDYWGSNLTDAGLAVASDSHDNAYITGFVSNVPPYPLQSANYSVEASNIQTSSPILQPREAEGTVNTAAGMLQSISGNETYAGQEDLFLFKYGSQPATSTIPLFLTLMTTLIAPVVLKVRSRRNNHYRLPS